MSTTKITSATRSMERAVMPAAPTARRRRRPAGSGWPPGRPRWSPGWPPPRCGTTTRSPRGCPGGTTPPWSPLVNMTSPLCSGVCGGTRSAVIELPGPCPSTIPLYWFPGPKVTPTLDWPSVTRRTTEVWWKDWITWPTSPPAPTTGIADVDAVGPALVQRDGRGEVRRVLVLGLRGDGRQRLQERAGSAAPSAHAAGSPRSPSRSARPAAVRSSAAAARSASAATRS